MHQGREESGGHVVGTVCHVVRVTKRRGGYLASCSPESDKIEDWDDLDYAFLSISIQSIVSAQLDTNPTRLNWSIWLMSHMGSGSDHGLLTRGSPNVITGFPRLLFFTQAVRLLCRRPTQPPDMGDGTPRKYGRMISGEDTLRTMKTVRLLKKDDIEKLAVALNRTRWSSSFSNWPGD